MHSTSRRTIIVSTFVIVFVSALAFLYYVVFPGWIRKHLDALALDSKEPYNISIEKINATAWPIGLQLKNVSIRQMAPDSINTDSVFCQKITIKHFSLLSFLFQKKYKTGHITLNHLVGEWTLPTVDTSKAETIFPFQILCQKLSFKNVSLTLKKKDSSQETTIENGNTVLKNVLLKKDSAFSTLTYQIGGINTETVNHVTSDSLYSFRAHHILYSDKDSTLQVDSFLSSPNLKKYAFARMHLYQSDRIDAAFKNIMITQCDLTAVILKGDMVMSSIHADTFILDIFRDRRRPFHHKRRPLFQDLVHAYPGVLSVDSITAHHGKIVYTEHDTDAEEPGIIWFTDVTARVKHLYNDTTVSKPHDTLIVAAQARAMGKGEIQFESKGLLQEPQNSFVFTGLMENIPVAAFNPILIPNVTIEALEGHLHGIYFNFHADNSIATGDLIFRYTDLHLQKVDEETKASKGLKDRVLTRLLNRQIIDHNPLPDDTLRAGIIYFERDPEKMYFSYMLKSIFSGIKETVLKKNKE